MPKTFLKHIEAITSHRDTALLDKSVITSLQELLGVEEIFLYDIVHLPGSTLLAAVTTWSDASGVHSRHDTLGNEDYQPVTWLPALLPHLLPEELPGVAPAAENSDEPRRVIPVRVDRKTIACCEIRYPSPPTAHQRDLAGGILGLYRNYLALLEDSQIDTLTGLSNRKTFERSLAGLLLNDSPIPPPPRNANREERRREKGPENWLAIIDIDHFKRINDGFGHLYGDEVLILLANLMRATFRQRDRLFRFGGEEFVVLLRQVNYEDALAALERFRVRVSEHIFPQVGQVTASVGFAMILPSDTPNAVLGYADEALYFAKDHGRNQVHCYERLIETGDLVKKRMHTEVDLF